MNTAVTAGLIAAAAGGVSAASSPRVVYRLAVPYGRAAADGCHGCGALFRNGMVGWLPVHQRCRRCRRRLGPPWWLMTGIGATACGLLTVRLTPSDPGSLPLLVAWIVLAQAGLVLSAIDVAVRRLPTPMVTGTAVSTGLLITVAAVLRGDSAVLVGAALGGIMVGAAYLALAFMGPGAIGGGDVRLAAVIGVMSGSASWETLFLAVVTPYVLAFPVALRRQWRRRHDSSMSGVIPFGPFLVAGAIVAAVLTAS